MADITIIGHVFPNIFAQLAKTVIGGIPVKVALEQSHSDRLEVTDHPVQSGASITDHSYKRPVEVSLRCGWSNSSLEAQSAIVSGLFSGGTMAAASYIDGVYSQLLQLQESRQTFDITTIRRKYRSMLMTSLEVTTDQKTGQALMVEASFRQVIIVDTSTSSLPPMQNQADPASTAEVQNGGSATATPGMPAPGGALPPQQWGASSAFGSAHITQ